MMNPSVLLLSAQLEIIKNGTNKKDHALAILRCARMYLINYTTYLENRQVNKSSVHALTFNRKV